MSSIPHDNEQLVRDFLAPLATIEPAGRPAHAQPREASRIPTYLGYGLVALGAVALIAVVALIASHPVNKPKPVKEPNSLGIFSKTPGWVTVGGGQIKAYDPNHPFRTHTIANIDGTPVSWSQDGTKLLIVTGHGDVVLNADGTYRTIARAPGSGNHLLDGGSFTPDDKRVVYEKLGSLYSVSSAGGKPTVILHRGRPYPYYLLGGWSGGQVSPDGRTLVYLKVGGSGNHQTQTISAVNLDGSDPRTLVTRQAIISAMGVSDIQEIDGLAWFKDSSGFLVEGYSKGGPCSVFAIDADGSNLRRWGPSGLCPIRGALGSDGQLAFSTGVHDHPALVITNQAGQVIHTAIFPKTHFINMFAWQPGYRAQPDTSHATTDVAARLISPDGQQRVVLPSNGRPYPISVENIDGSDRHPILTLDKVMSLPGASENPSDHARDRVITAWFGDSKSVALVLEGPTMGCGVYGVDANGRNLWKIGASSDLCPLHFSGKNAPYVMLLHSLTAH